jgi:hypothetical protein
MRALHTTTLLRYEWGVLAGGRTASAQGGVTVGALPRRVVPVIRATGSPTRYFARYSAARVAGVPPCVSLSQAA